ncbi:MAG: BatD family protein [Spongiibacteraceae bacterium]
MVDAMTITHFQKLTLSIIFLLACICANAGTLAARASVDRTVVDEGDSLTLSIRIDDTGSYDEPDLSVLQKDFEIYGSQQNSQHAIINGRIESHTDWQTTLIPKRSGQLQIPPIAVAGTQTQPITIQVNPQSQNSAIDGSEPVFLEVKTDRDSIYVQQQLLLTARVYVAVQLDNMQLSKPEFDNANVKQLAETTFNRSVNGTPYEVHELTYAIFPQQPGELTIPELVFNAVEIVGSHSMFNFPGRGRSIRKISKQMTVHVKPIPKNFTGSVWLPARNLTLTGSWSGDQQHLAAGDSITRSITIRADGLLAAQLPKLDQPQLSTAKLYADQPKLDDATDASGVHGKRIENTALIPTQAGQMQLPETRIIWWDIDSDSEKVATLPGETLTVAAGTATTTASPPPPQPSVSTSQMTAPAVDTSAANATTSTSLATLTWQVATGIFLLLWLITLFAYLQLRRSRRITKTSDVETKIDLNEKAAWQRFADACRANNPAAARQQLLHWAMQFYCDEDVRSIEQLKRVSDNPSLLRELQLLDNRLFGTLRDSGDWNGENLLRVVQEIKKQGSRKNTSNLESLPPLYPAA